MEECVCVVVVVHGCGAVVLWWAIVVVRVETQAKKDWKGLGRDKA